MQANQISHNNMDFIPKDLESVRQIIKGLIISDDEKNVLNLLYQFSLFPLDISTIMSETVLTRARIKKIIESLKEKNIISITEFNDDLIKSKVPKKVIFLFLKKKKCQRCGNEMDWQALTSELTEKMIRIKENTLKNLKKPVKSIQVVFFKCSNCQYNKPDVNVILKLKE
jgi:hypothetical protein